MDSNDDSLFADSEDTSSDPESDASSDSSSHEMPRNKIIILSAESLSTAEENKFVLPKLSTNNNMGKKNPVIVKAQPQYVFLPDASSYKSEHLSGLQIQNVLYNPKSKKRVRDKNVTSVEKNTLFKICKKYPEIEDKTCNNETNNRKRKAWEDIHEEFIAVCPDPESKDRSIRFLQGCWSRFRKEENKKARKQHAIQDEITEAISSLVPNRCSAASLSETESQPIPACLEEEGIVSSENTVDFTDLSVNTPKGCHNDGITSNSSPHLFNSDSNVVLSTDDLEVGLSTSDSKKEQCNSGSSKNGEKTVTLRVNNADGDATAGSLSSTNHSEKLCLNSAFETKPLSIRSLRRKALELAVEAEKEKLSAFRYQREAERERLAAMKFQKSAQRYALMAEKERYETELLKREAAKLSLEKLS